MRVLMITQRVDSEHDILGFTTDWIETLADRVEHIDVLAGYAGQYNLPENVTVYSYGKERGLSKPLRILKFERQCARITLEGVDIAFVHMIPNYVIAGIPWFRLTGTPVVLWYAHGHVDWNLRLAHHVVDRVVTSTDASFTFPSSKLEIVGQGIDTGRFALGSQDQTTRTRMLFVGRVDPVKNVETIINAVDILRGRNRGVSCRIVGDASQMQAYYDKLVRMTEEHNLKETVTFVGSVPYDEIVTEYQQAGLFVNASRTGSLDKTEVEAMACGTPVISCNQSYGDMVTESELDEELLTFQPNDSESLATTVEHVLELDDAAYRQLGIKSRQVAVEHHSTDSLMDSITDILTEVAES